MGSARNLQELAGMLQIRLRQSGSFWLSLAVWPMLCAFHSFATSLGAFSPELSLISCEIKGLQLTWNLNIGLVCLVLFVCSTFRPSALS